MKTINKFIMTLGIAVLFSVILPAIVSGDGDAILIDLNNKQYTYIVKQKTIIQRGADVPEDGLSATNSILTLISCWPPGKDYQRITV